MKLKFYLRGLGVGILVTTFILTVAYNFKDNKNTTTQNSSTVASILNATKSGSTENTEHITEQLKETVEETKTELVIQETIVAQTEDSTVSKIETKVGMSDTITVVLSNVISSENAAEAIEKSGVIEDWKDFNKYLVSSGYALKIHNGTYTLYKGQDYESIAKIITGK